MQPKVFFPHLDGLRFFAFFSVFIFHCYFDIPEPVSGHGVYLALHKLFANGDLGVNFFFTLSGFLITYLLLREEQDAGKINVKNFYLRRVLRIWPLYYTTFLFGYFAFQYLIRLVGVQLTETANPWYYVFFLGNYNSIIHGAPLSGSLSVLWSIAIEEQFYLCWPILLVVCRRHRNLMFLGVILISLVFRAVHHNDHAVLFYHTLSVMSDLAIGSWLGWWCFTRRYGQNSLNLTPRVLSAAVYASGFALVLFREEIMVHPVMVVAERLIYSIFFAYIILEQSYSSNSIFKMGRWEWISYWGRYTYGLYCLHIPAMVFTEGLVLALGAENSLWWLLWGKAVSTFLLALAFSKLSYRYIESPFLRMKARF